MSFTVKKKYFQFLESYFFLSFNRPYNGFGSHLDELRQPGEKLRCLYENLMSNNFRKTAVLKKNEL